MQTQRKKKREREGGRKIDRQTGRERVRSKKKKKFDERKRNKKKEEQPTRVCVHACISLNM